MNNFDKPKPVYTKDVSSNFFCKQGRHEWSLIPNPKGETWCLFCGAIKK